MKNYIIAIILLFLALIALGSFVYYWAVYLTKHQCKFCKMSYQLSDLGSSASQTLHKQGFLFGNL